MRYKLDSNGFIKYVLFGCYSGEGAEYSGTVPAGYDSLVDWADNAIINAYHLDENGNLMLDAQRMNYLQTMYEQQAIDYAPVLHKDLYATNEIIEAQYKKATATGSIITITNARGIAPMVKITGLTGNPLSVFAQTKNMLRNDAISLEVNGLTFTREGSGIKISGTATADVEYTISGGEAEPLFALLQGHSYCLNVGGYNCELLYFDGETTEQVYTGIGGVINLSESKRVSEVKLKFASGQTVNDTIYPTLAYGTTTIAYEECQTKVYNMELPEYEAGASIIIGEGLAVLYSGGKTYVVGRSNMGLLNGYNMIYTSQGNNLEVTYTTNEFLIDDMAFLQGTATTTGKFMILEDGSIVATDGTFNGEVTCTKLTVAAGATISGIDTGVSAGDVTVITQNSIKTGALKLGGNIYRIVNKSLNETDDYLLLGINTSGNLQVGSPSDLANYGKLRFYSPGVMQFYPDGQTADLNYTLELTADGATVWGDLTMRYGSDICMGTGDVVDSSGNPKYYGSGDSPDFGRVYCTGIGSSSDYPSVVYCNNVAVQTETTISNNNAGFNSNYGYIQEYSGSSKKFKHDIRSMPDELKEKIEGLYDVEVKCWKYNEDYLDEEDELFGVETFGLIAEDLNEVLPEAITHKADGSISNYRDRNLLNAMLVLLQDQKKEIDSLKASIEEIKNGGTV